MTQVDTQHHAGDFPLDSPQRRRVPPLLRRAWYSLNQAFRRRIRHLGLTPNQFTILRWLIEKEPRGLTQRRLAQLMASDANTITSILNRMEAKGLIKRTPHKTDKRALRVVIKPTGRELYHKARPIALELQGQLLDCLPPEQREPFLEQLAIVADACQNILSDAADHGPPNDPNL